MKIFRTEVFQGNLSKKNYFEGWYFKNVSEDNNIVYAFIPGISLTGIGSHAFIQVINGITGETHYITYNIADFKWRKDILWVQVGKSVFTDKYIDINIEDESIKIKGRVDFSGTVKFPKTILSPSIMGWYAYIPFMECNHGIVSVNHSLEGNLIINDRIVNFSRGKGYIEKDWGTSFPEAWIWLHSNSFEKHDTSLFVSVAKIPWVGKFFMGFICFLYLDGKFYKFCTYNNSKIISINHEGNELKITLKSKGFILKLVATSKSSGELKAPSLGQMNRRIKESIDSEVHVQLFDKSKKLLYDDIGKRAGLEIIDKIFHYLKQIFHYLINQFVSLFVSKSECNKSG